uniref:DUF3795 domain-containing protein n=1 Tax=Parastrongyloides trichosuri TaxID=131310 RepID=A0A0N4Z9C8_PARTI
MIMLNMGLGEEVLFRTKFCNKGIFCKGFCEANGYPDLRDMCRISHEDPDHIGLKRCICVSEDLWTPN